MCDRKNYCNCTLVSTIPFLVLLYYRSRDLNGMVGDLDLDHLDLTFLGDLNVMKEVLP